VNTRDPPGAAVRSRLHVAVAVLLLGSYGAWVVVNAVKAGAWPSSVVGIVLLAAAVGAATGRRWSGYLIYALAALFAIEWVWIVVGTYRRGFLGNYLRSIPALQAVLSFVPAGGMFLLAGYCCYVAHKYVLGRGRGA
jgi:hypothetical protein